MSTSVRRPTAAIHKAISLAEVITTFSQSTRKTPSGQTWTGNRKLATDCALSSFRSPVLMSANETPAGTGQAENQRDGRRPQAQSGWEGQGSDQDRHCLFRPHAQ